MTKKRKVEFGKGCTDCNIQSVHGKQACTHCYWFDNDNSLPDLNILSNIFVERREVVKDRRKNKVNDRRFGFGVQSRRKNERRKEIKIDIESIIKDTSERINTNKTEQIMIGTDFARLEAKVVNPLFKIPEYCKRKSIREFCMKDGKCRDSRCIYHINSRWNKKRQ